MSAVVVIVVKDLADELRRELAGQGVPAKGAGK